MTREVANLHIESLTMKGLDNNQAVLSMNDASGFIEGLTLKSVTFDGENQARKAIFPDNGMLLGKIHIESCKF